MTDGSSPRVPCVETNPETEVCLSRHDWSNTDPLGSLVDAIASLEGVDPMELDVELGTTLFEHVDPEALKRLVTAGDRVEIAFAIDGIGVRVSGEGDLLVCHRNECALAGHCSGI